MKTTPEYEKGYCLSHKRWPDQLFDGETARIMIGLYSDQGGNGEMAISWLDIGDNKPIPRLEVFSDGWQLLYQIAPELLPRLVELAKPGLLGPEPDEVAAVLDSIGFRDMTYRNW